MDTALDTRPPHVASPAAARRLGTAIYGALVLVLLFLASFAVWAAATTQQATARADHATILSDDYQQARYWIGAEKVLERTYRLAPGPRTMPPVTRCRMPLARSSTTATPPIGRSSPR